MEWVASTLHTTSVYGVSSITSITTAVAHISAASSRLNWRPRRFIWTRLFRRKTKSGLCACAITFQTQSTTVVCFVDDNHEAAGFEAAAEGARHVPQYIEVSGVRGSF